MEHGLTSIEAKARLAAFGPNALPKPQPPSLVLIFLRQFLSPLIHILLAAALISLALGDLKDAIFIAAVLLVNGLIGTAQEYSAGRAAAALRNLEETRATVVRDGGRMEIDAREVVPGDLLVLEAGARVPADVDLLSATDLQVDESLLTGESVPVKKQARAAADDPRNAKAFAGTLITRGRAKGEVVHTGMQTEIGKIAGEISKRSRSTAPLVQRMEVFARRIALAIGAAIALIFAVGLAREMETRDLFMMAVGLAVSAIPEGLPVAISIALAISMRRMAKARVIVRKMPAVESLGSCTLIATDKTGTLTLNEMTVTDISLPDGTRLVCEAGQDLDACTIVAPEGGIADARARVAALLRAAALPNEARLLKEADGWRGTGDTVDVALLAAARKGGLLPEEIHARYPLIRRIPYEPEQRYAASFHRRQDRVCAFVKGAPETLIAMADSMDLAGTRAPIDRAHLIAQKEALAAQGLRVLAFAEGEISNAAKDDLGPHRLADLTFLGLAGMQDPVRPEVPGAIRACREAGITVVMVTGDDPKTASVIARNAGIAFAPDEVASGKDVRSAEAKGEEALDSLTRRTRIYARVEPTQKLAIVLSLARNGHFVAVTGDGVNDAPALKHAHVGVAMGRKGTDVAKESADIIISDDNFASIVNGIAEGRVAYANIRKVVFLLVSTGAAEVILFLLALPLGLPMPLLPAQLLWLNLVTNGVQDVALATERAEGDELSRPPRRPAEPIFDRLMIRRVVRSALVMGGFTFGAFWWLIQNGYGVEQARNLVLLLFVLFENFQALNSRSEHHSLFRRNFFANRFLLFSVLGAQALHIAAMYTPGLSDALRIAPVSLAEWGVLLLAASSVLIVMEADKWLGRRRAGKAALAAA